MRVYKAEAEVGGDGTLTVRGVPFAAGERVEVIVLPVLAAASGDRYPLHGVPVRYDDPFGPATDAADWDALR